jgi:hypothetical protein
LNAVILYTGNVCSTAFVAYAALSESVFVPVQEQLDHYRFKELVPEGDRQAPVLAEVLDAMFARQPHDLFDANGFKRFLGWSDMPDKRTRPHTLFKWRCWTDPTPGQEEISQAFARNEVVPALMMRASLSEHAIKMHASEKHYGNAHPQRVTTTRRMAPEAYADYLQKQAETRIVFDEADIEATLRIAKGLLFRSRRMVELAGAYFPHAADPRVMIAETIFRPLIDNQRFNATLRDLLPGVSPVAEEAEPQFRKGGLDLEHCANAEDVMRQPRMVDYAKRYDALVGSLATVGFGE